VWEAKSQHWQFQQTDRMLSRIGNLFHGRGDARELGRYGLGSTRTVAQWADAAGVDLHP
jgi:hypothetical protein